MEVNNSSCTKVHAELSCIAESEFWLATGKVLLALSLIVFTFVVMLGANPLHDRFGFRNWNRQLFLSELQFSNQSIIFLPPAKAVPVRYSSVC